METTTKYAYQALMAEHKLTISELPADARIGIDSIYQIEKAISMAEKKGKKVKQSTLDKLKANDKWTVREILDYVEEKTTKTNTAPLPNPATVVVAEIVATTTVVDDGKTTTADTTNTTVVVEPDAKGVKIDAELKVVFDSGKTEITLDEMKSLSPTAYNTIFDTYDASGDNGVETTHYSLIETSEKKFTLKKI